MPGDEALMLEFQRGSQEALEELFARYRGPLYGFFRRRLPSHMRAGDLTQEVFLAVMRAVSRYEPRSLVRTYLYPAAPAGLGPAAPSLSSDSRWVAFHSYPTTEQAYC
jgi:RNA polymerase sigma-70 factor (ECF subfamily)